MYPRRFVRRWMPLAVLGSALASPWAVAGNCPESDLAPLPDCAPVELTNEDRNYSVRNQCDFPIMAVLKSTTGAEAVFFLDPGEVDAASLPEEMAVESIRCCKSESPPYFCTASDAHQSRKG